MSEFSIAEPKQHLPELDGIRGLSILMVLLFHSSLNTNHGFQVPRFEIYMEHLSRGVQLFFVVSAFTLFRNASIPLAGTEFRTRDFYLKRAFRILPLWWVICFAYWFIYDADTRATLMTASFLFGFFPNRFFLSVTPVGWSLFVEESFYALFPLWLKIIQNWKRCVLLLIAAHLGAIIYESEMLPTVPLKLTANIGAHPVSNYYAFFWGILAYQISSGSLLNEAVKNRGLRLGFNVLSLVSLCAVPFTERMLGTALVSILLLAAVTKELWLYRICRQKFLVAAGGLSYGIYLWHPILQSQVIDLTTKLIARYIQPSFNLSGELETLVRFPFLVVASLAASWLSFRLLERPIVRWGRKRIARLTPTR